MTINFETLFKMFEERVRSGDVIYYESIREPIKVDNKYEFDLAYCPALVRRISDEKCQKESKSVKINPFLPPDPRTLIKSIALENGASYNLFFNKYCVAPMHLLLTTVEFVFQDSHLNWDDFRAVKLVLEEFSSDEANWMVFYNCGMLSGASQPHKHIQLILISEGGKVPLRPSDMEEIYGSMHFYSFSSDSTDDDVLKNWYDSYTKLMSYVKDGRSTNVLFTKKWMLVVPRKQLGLRDWNPNSLIFVGYFLSRSDEETKMIKEIGPLNIIKSLGCIKDDQEIKS